MEERRKKFSLQNEPNICGCVEKIPCY